jgi:hypothetical protein
MTWVYNNALDRAKQYGIEVRACADRHVASKVATH